MKQELRFLLCALHEGSMQAWPVRQYPVVPMQSLRFCEPHQTVQTQTVSGMHVPACFVHHQTLPSGPPLALHPETFSPNTGSLEPKMDLRWVVCAVVVRNIGRMTFQFLQAFAPD